jgi:hypothetical protein
MLTDILAGGELDDGDPVSCAVSSFYNHVRHLAQDFRRNGINDNNDCVVLDPGREPHG